MYIDEINKNTLISCAQCTLETSVLSI